MLEKLKSAYKLWHQYHELLPKTQKYSLGNRIDKYLIETIEAVVTAVFLPREEKRPWVLLGTRKNDTVKVLLMVLWETRSIDDKKYLSLSVLLNEVGKMLGGWSGQLKKQNSPAETGKK